MTAPPLTGPARVATGHAARSLRSRRSLADWSPAPDRPDPVAALLAQEPPRIPALLPLRHARMAATPFAFYRGSAVVMATDLAGRPATGLDVRLSGDAHLSNFGFFAAADRRVVFDLDDFDESLPGPFEWDLLRLATSCILAAREMGASQGVGLTAARQAGAAYRQSVRERAARTALTNWYAREDALALGAWVKRDRLGRVMRTDLRKDRAAARGLTTWSAVTSLTKGDGPTRRFVDKAPTVVRLGLTSPVGRAVVDIVEHYVAASPPARREAMSRYFIVDVGHKVVGVGSVGLMDFIVLLRGPIRDDLVILQVKQAQESALSVVTQVPDEGSYADRVVTSAALIQPDPDVFLGSTASATGVPFYVRQLRDMKWAPDLTTLTSAGLVEYAQLCGHTLARPHARTGDVLALDAYLGRSGRVERAAGDFAVAYAKQVRSDAATFRAATKEGSVSSATTVDRDELVAGLATALGLG